MKAITFPAFRKNGTAVQLAELLELVPNNQLVWSIVFFSGMGAAPANLSMAEFEKKISSIHGGLTMSWQELKVFAAKLDQTIDCVIVGSQSKQDVLDALAKGGNFSSCEFFFNAFDSTDWSVFASDPVVMERFSHIFGAINQH